nr:premnaspirodiene oxygenase-like [Tanacetum cinerariifolium]
MIRYPRVMKKAQDKVREAFKRSNAKLVVMTNPLKLKSLLMLSHVQLILNIGRTRRRMCPCINFGLVSVKLFLAQMLYYFDWKLPDGLSSMELDMTE